MIGVRLPIVVVLCSGAESSEFSGIPDIWEAIFVVEIDSCELEEVMNAGPRLGCIGN